MKWMKDNNVCFINLLQTFDVSKDINIQKKESEKFLEVFQTQTPIVNQ